MIRLLLLGLIVALVSGCNTVSGAGKDISNSADWVKGKVTGGSSPKHSPSNKSDSSAPVQPAAPAQPDTAPAAAPAPSQIRT